MRGSQMADDEKKLETHLDVYDDRSVLHEESGDQHHFHEGDVSKEARERNIVIRKALDEGFLEERIEQCKVGADIPIDPVDKELFDGLVGAVTSEVGRALVGITVLQLCIKVITPEQDVRLHKASRGSRNFSWVDGVPMRAIDRNYITPVLRKHDLIRLNRDGFMMTRSLAENYPYSKVYKAQMRGARDQWLEIVSRVEKIELDPGIGLNYLLALLINRSSKFQTLANEAIEAAKSYINTDPSFDAIVEFIEEFVDQSDYSARLFEVAVHGLYQVLAEKGELEFPLKALTQMRSANKKHGNIGDIELLEREDSNQVIEAWDAKYGKPYLRDELEEVAEKLANHPETKRVGFIVDDDPDLRDDIVRRIDEICDYHGIELHIFSFKQWIEWVLKITKLEQTELANDWLLAFVESLAQKRRDLAPIDEPTYDWVEKLAIVLKTASSK